MATPNVSSTIDFVKKYPITLCGFSLLFMPSVYRLLLYFTPLLISTAIFIVAMMSWGPSMPSERGKKRGKDWAFNGSLRIYEEEEEEEEEEEVAEVPEVGKKSKDITQQEEISIKGNTINVKPHPNLQDPADPHYEEESKRVGTGSSISISRGQAEPDPDLPGERVGAASCNACSVEPDPDLHGELVEAASYNACSAAEPDPDLHAEKLHVDPAHDQDFSAEKHLHGAEPDHHHHAEPAPSNHDRQAAAGDHLNYHDAEPTHDDAESNHLDYHDAEPNHDDAEPNHDDAESNHLDYHDAEPDPDLDGECAAHAEAHVQNDDLHAAMSELRQKLGMMKRAPYSDDPRDILSHQPAERLQTLQAAA